jgi:hypothetical protein
VHDLDQCTCVSCGVGEAKSLDLIGAVVPRGAAGPTQWLCDARTRMGNVQDHFLMEVVAVKCGSIDLSASNHSLSIN